MKMFVEGMRPLGGRIGHTPSENGYGDLKPIMAIAKEYGQGSFRKR